MKSHKNIFSARHIAALVIQNVVYEKQSLSEVLPATLGSVPDLGMRATIQDFSYNVLRWYFPLKKTVDFLLDKPLKKKDQDIECILLVGLYEIFYTQTPSYAIVNETVACTQGIKKTWAKGLVNAALRRTLREKQTIESKFLEDEEAKYSHPAWLIRLLETQWPEKWQTILRENNKLPPMWLRVNKQKTSPTEYTKTLAAAGVAFSAEESVPSAVLLEKPTDVAQVPGFYEGFCSVQDAAGQYAASLLDLHTGLRVLDACAAPGSKTCHLLESTPAIEVHAIEKSPSRAKLIDSNFKRLGLHARLIVDAAENIDKWWDKKEFDRILLDVPCSATGVIRRHPDIKLLRRETDISELVIIQQNLLTSLWHTLKPGGKLLYSTCSILCQENSEIIKWFLENTPAAKIIPVSIPQGYDTAFGTQLFPGDLFRDGFFYALLLKEAKK